MMKKIVVTCLVLLLAVIPCLFSETQVVYTNQFFAGKTPGGACYVFIYNDSFIFVNSTGRQTEKTKILYNMTGVNDVFISGNVFCVKRRESLYCYDLARLAGTGNDGRRLDDCGAQIEQIDSISALYPDNDTVYYTKNGDQRLYQYTPNKKPKDTPVPGIQVKPSQYASYILYTPMSERRNTEYQQERRNMESRIAQYNSIESASTAQPDIEKIISDLPQSRRSADAIYAETKNYFAGKAKYESSLFDNFLTLAEVSGKRAEAESLINRIQTSNAVLQPARITAYYNSKDEYERINRPDVLVERKKAINDNITRLTQTLSTDWGRNYDGKKDGITQLFNDSSQSQYKWRNSGDLLIEYRSKKSKIDDFDSRLQTLCGNTNFAIKNQNYQEYLALQEYYKYSMDLVDGRNRNGGYRSENILNSINTIGSLANKFQQDASRELKDSFFKDYDELTQFKKDAQDVETSYKQEVQRKFEEKQRSLKSITDSVSSRYRKEEIFDKITLLKVPLVSYDPAYINYCILSNEEKRINGFTITDQIAINASVPKNNSGEEPRFIRPSGYPLVSIARDGVFILTSPKTISVYDISKPKITKLNPLTVSEGIFYLVKSDTSQYIVTNDNKLLKLSINGGTVRSEPAGMVSGRDTVMVTGDIAYMLSSDGLVNGRAAGTIRVRSCNSQDTFDISVRNGQFIIQ